MKPSKMSLLFIKVFRLLYMLILYYIKHWKWRKKWIGRSLRNNALIIIIEEKTGEEGQARYPRNRSWNT